MDTATQSTSAEPAAIDLPRAAIEAFCRRWKIIQLDLFGSILRDDFGPDSDVDFLVTFAPDSRWTLLDLVTMHEAMSQLLGSEVDLVSKRGVAQSANWIRRREIMGSARPYYVAG